MKRAVVFFAEGFEEIEAVTPADILARGGVEVVTAGVGGKIVRGSRGISIACDVTADELQGRFDAVVVPGGMPGAANLAADQAVCDAVLRCSEAGGLVAAICAAPAVVLGPLGLLEGHEATCYPGFEDKFPAGVRFSSKGVVTSGDLITARGPGKAYAFSLEVLRHLTDDETVHQVAESSLFI